MAMAKEPRTGAGRRISHWTWVLMALVFVGTLLAVWLVPTDEEPAAPSLPRPPAKTGLAPVPVVEGAAGMREGDRARVIVARLRADGEDPDPDLIFAEAEGLRGEGHLDDAYLLYRFAAIRGHAQAALVLGTQADPAFYSAATSSLPGPERGQAYKWYSKAAAKGNEEAAGRLQDLRERVEQAAAAGDEHAQRLTLQWR